MKKKVSKQGNRKKSVVKKLEPYLWLLPAFCLFITFTFVPFLQTIVKSLFIVDSLGRVKQFVGLGNYIYILQDEKFLKAIGVTLKFVVLTVPSPIIIGTVLAYVANERRRLSRVYEACFAIPMAMSASVTAMIFQMLYVPEFGLLNNILGLDIRWLSDPRYALFAIALIQNWLASAQVFIYMLSAMRGVPQSLVESSSLDGASPVKQFISIYLPLTTPTLFYLVCTNLIYSMMMMSLINVLTAGGPANSTMTIMQYVYRQFAAAGNYTNANPAAIIAFIMTFVVTMMTFIWEKKGVNYS